MTKKTSTWSVYLIRNCHNALYCGVTIDVPRRFQQHQQGKGAKALKGKGPLTLEWSMVMPEKSLAMKAEYFIKQLPKIKKELLVTHSLQLVLNDKQVWSVMPKLN